MESLPCEIISYIAGFCRGDLRAFACVCASINAALGQAVQKLLRAPLINLRRLREITEFLRADCGPSSHDNLSLEIFLSVDRMYSEALDEYSRAMIATAIQWLAYQRFDGNILLSLRAEKANMSLMRRATRPLPWAKYIWKL